MHYLKEFFLILGLAMNCIGCSNDLYVIDIGKFGYINKTGKIIINPQFDKAYDFSEEGLAAVMVNDKWGFVNKSGQFVINPQFDSAWGFTEGLAAVMVNDKWGYIDKLGKMVINPQFDVARVFSDDGLARVLMNNKWGYINERGNFEINPQFEVADGFYEGFALVKIGDKYCFIDKSGKIVINPQFYVATEFKNGLALVYGEKYGYINKSGDYIWSYDKGATINMGTECVDWQITKKTETFKCDDYLMFIVDNNFKPIGFSKIEYRISRLTDNGESQPFRVWQTSMDPKVFKWGMNIKVQRACDFVENQKGKFKLIIVGENTQIVSKEFEVL